MKLTTTIRYTLARLLVKAGSLGVVPPWITQTFFEPTFRALVKEGYKKNAAFFACVSALAFAYPEPPLMVYASDDDDAEPLPNHPVRKLLMQPNPRMGERRFKIVVMTYIAIGGVCYVHKVRNGGRKVIQLWPYHAGQMIPVPGGPDWLLRYDFDDGSGRLQPIPVEDVIALTWPDVDPEQPWTAMPPLCAAAGDVDAANEIRRYVFTLLKNDAVPRGVLKLPETAGLTDPEIIRMKARWRETYGGDARGDIAILEGGAEYIRTGLNMEELAASSLFDIPEAHIASVMRVPPIIAHLNVGLQRSTFANYGEAREAFTQDTMAPIWAISGDELRAGLEVDFGPVFLRHDLSKVQALQENIDAKWTRVTAAYEKGIITDRNEARGLLNLPAEPEAQDAAIKSTPILGYHIESGVVSRNEARAQLGLPSEDETMDDQLRRLQGLLTVAQTAVNVGFDVQSALRLVGLDPGLAGEPPPPPAPPQLPGPADIEPSKAFKRRPALETEEQRIERRVRSYLAAQYAKAADAVSGG